jgi:hypothetical protein
MRWLMVWAFAAMCRLRRIRVLLRGLTIRTVITVSGLDLPKVTNKLPFLQVMILPTVGCVIGFCAGMPSRPTMFWCYRWRLLSCGTYWAIWLLWNRG